MSTLPMNNPVPLTAPGATTIPSATASGSPIANTIANLLSIGVTAIQTEREKRLAVPVAQPTVVQYVGEAAKPLPLALIGVGVAGLAAVFLLKRKGKGGKRRR